MVIIGNMRRYVVSSERLQPFISVLSESPDNDVVTATSAAFEEHLTAHFHSFFQNQLTPNLTSGPVDPSLGHRDPFAEVVPVVSLQFEELVMNTRADVFLVIYVPWCAYCKAFENVLKELLEHYKGLDTPRNLMLAKLDGGANEINHMNVRVLGYPTFYLFLEGDKDNPVEYEGERTAEAITQFIAYHQSLRKPVAGDVTSEEYEALKQQHENQLEMRHQPVSQVLEDRMRNIHNEQFPDQSKQQRGKSSTIASP